MKLSAFARAAVLLTYFSFPWESMAATFSVITGSGGDCNSPDFASCSFQEALNQAAVNGQDDTINLAPGTYSTTANGNAPFAYSSSQGNGLAILGTRTQVTILDGGGNSQILDLLDNGLTASGLPIQISGISFQNSNATAASGGAVNIIADKVPILLSGNNFTNNQSSFSGGALSAFSDSGNLSVQDNVFTLNTAQQNSGAANVIGTNGNILFSGNQLINNTAMGAMAGGAFLNTVNGTIEVSSNTFSGNQAPGNQAGGLAIDGGTAGATITGNTFLRNEAGACGGFLLLIDGNSVIANNVLAANTATPGGGGGFCTSWADAVQLDIVNNTLSGNAAGATGGGIFLSPGGNSSVANIFNNIVLNNTASPQGDDIDFNNPVAPNATSRLFNNDFGEFCRLQNPGSCDPAALGPDQGNNLLGIDPLFVDAGADNFRLGANSPVIDEGTATAPGLPAIDFDGNPRVFGAEPDIGGFEAVPVLAVNPGNLNFGFTEVDSEVSLDLTITNDGSLDLVITGMTLSDTVDFFLDSNGGDDPCGSQTPTLAPGESCTVELTFSPSLEDVVNAILSIESNVPGSPTEVFLSGIGTAKTGCSLGLGGFSGPSLLMILLPVIAIFFARIPRGRL